MADRYEGLRVRKLAGEPGSGVHHTDHITGEPALRPLKGVVFTDTRGRRTDDVPKKISVPHDYVAREPWIEFVNPRGVVKPAGPATNPFAKTHQFVHADEIILHMLDGDHRYKVTHQPGKYEGAEHVQGAEHVASEVAGDPNTHVDWFFEADLIKEK